ncbi:MAPEG family domain-containing protein [Phthorimaea operculella]|nr:MAPEG family domain-containing protein [Phthorimaea operculella]
MVPVSEPLVETFVAHSAVLALKVLGMSFLTARQRIKKKVFANEEDAVRSGAKVKYDDPDVERVRRAHLNDLENIPVFWIVGGLYLTTGPSPVVATWLIRAFTASRVLHTLVYAVKPMPQPARGLAFGIANFITIYMGVKVVMHYFHAL